MNVCSLTTINENMWCLKKLEEDTRREQSQKCAAVLHRDVVEMRRTWNIFSPPRIYCERGYIENEGLIKKQFSAASALRVRSERATLVFRHAFRFRGNRKQCNCPPLLIPLYPQSRKRIFLYTHVRARDICIYIIYTCALIWPLHNSISRE